MPFKPIFLSLLCFALTAGISSARDTIQIAGSSTVLPYAIIVAEAFGENFDYPTPVVESGGSSAGLKRFCQGIGTNSIDIANASRAIRETEIKTCAANGVKDIIEVRFGYDGIVFASDINGASFAFEPKHIYYALAEKIVKNGKTIPNPYKNWTNIDTALPNQTIRVFVPGTKHGTREVFEDKVVLAGCKAIGDYDVFKTANNGDKKAAEKQCIKLRTDGVSIDIDGDYTETLTRIDSNKNAIGVFGLSFYENNTDKLKVATMSGIKPNTQTISSGDYPVSRPLFFYIKKAHIGVIPGLKDYAAFFVSNDIAGANSPLAEYGLVPDPNLAITQQNIADEKTM